MKISEYKIVDTRIAKVVAIVDDINEFGEVIGHHEEIVEKQVPVLGMVERDMTPEEEAQQELIDAIEDNREPTTEEKVEKLMAMQDKTVSISRFEFDLLEMTYADTTYRITEDDGTITTVKGEY